MPQQEGRAEDSQGPGPHVIRLRGPWQSDHGRVKLPATWAEAFGDHCERVTLSRRFNRPSSLDPGESVYLRVESPHRLVAVLLNEAPVALPKSRGDVTGRLLAANQVRVELQRCGSSPGGLLEVQLEITQGA